MNIRVTVDTKKFGLEMRVFAKQTDYATMKAVNAVTVKAQANVRAHMDDVFTLRRKAWAQASAKVKPFATKETLTATLSIDPAGGKGDILAQHQTWFSKVAKSGRTIAVPLSNGVVRTDEKKVIPTAKRPRNLKGAFKHTDSDGQQFIMVRKGRGKKQEMKPAYLLLTRAKVKPRFQFEKVVTETVRKEWAGEFAKAWTHAVNTSLSK